MRQNEQKVVLLYDRFTLDYFQPSERVNEFGTLAVGI